MKFKRIYLTGMMGSGKSTVGKILAGYLSVPFIDLDEFIVERAGKSIPDIFEQEGERRFRSLESEALELCSKNKGVFGLGGGAVLDTQNREMMMESGLVAYLRATPETLERRLRSEADGRPLLAGEISLDERIAGLLNERSAIYELAHIIIDTDDLTPEEVASALQKEIGEKIDA